MNDIFEVGENIYLIDDQLYSIPKWGCVYLLNEERKALIETGPATSANAVLNGIKKVGVRPEDIAYLLVTHIHLDHSGGAGVLLKDMPQAQVIVHHKGARHLVDPAKLIRSIFEIGYGEELKRCGEPVPIEEHRVREVRDGDTIELSKGQVLKFIDAPGHAPHELCIYESRNGGLFTGDALGIYIPENEILLPFHTPPNFDLELSISTIKRLTEFNATRIYFSHFGVSHKAQETLQLAIDKLWVWEDIIARAAEENALDSAAERLVAQASAELEPIRKMDALYEFMTEFYLAFCAAGHIKNYKERHKLN